MLQLKTIKRLIEQYNEEMEANIQLVYTRFDYWDNVLSIEWEEKIEPLAYHEINKQFRCSILNQDLTKKQIREKLDQLYWSVKNPVFYQEWMDQTGLD